MAKLLLVEDDLRLAKSVRDWLTAQHYHVEVVNDGDAAADRLFVSVYDAILLDWELPGKTGVDLLKALRRRDSETPVLMITGRSTLPDKDEGYQAGLDDYLTKPFDLRELSMRLRALLRRSRSQDNVLQCGSLVVDPAARSVTVNDVPIPLSRKEFSLLEFLVKNPGELFSAEALLSRVWPEDTTTTVTAVTTCICRLRKKVVDAGGPPIETVAGSGYKLISL